MVYSQTALELLNQGFGFRNDAYGTSEFRLRAIIEFEIGELRNTDIPATLGVRNSIKSVIKRVEELANCSIDNLFGLWLTSQFAVLNSITNYINNCN